MTVRYQVSNCRQVEMPVYYQVSHILPAKAIEPAALIIFLLNGSRPTAPKI